MGVGGVVSAILSESAGTRDRSARERIWHLIAVHSRRPCPACGRPIERGDRWAFWCDEVWHAACAPWD